MGGGASGGPAQGGAGRDDEASGSGGLGAGAGSERRDAGPPEPPPEIGADEIYGEQVPRGSSWWLEDGRIHRADEEVVLHGINWFGLDASARALYGPTESRRTIADFLAQLKSLGFNALRVPLAPESINPGFPSESWVNRGQTDTGREHFDALLVEAERAGMYMLLDVHTCASAVGHLKESPIDPRCKDYGVDPWLADLKTLAEIADEYAPYVLGIDLFNEPYGLSYDEWKALAEQGGKVVLETNPNILVFVEGVGSKGYGGFTGVFWGENLSEAGAKPIDLPASRLVYSPHVYGPSISQQAYFKAPDFPANMPSIWDEHFGFLFGGAHAVVPGEFGGVYTGQDKIWQDAFVEYLLVNEARSFFYWCLNPNSGDTGGLLNSDWRTVNEEKHALLQRLME
jgi:endoglucanase